MKVIATKKGFYGSLREEGEVFTIADDKDLGSWMKKAEPEPEVKGKK